MNFITYVVIFYHVGGSSDVKFDDVMRLTEAKITVTSSSLPPTTLTNPLARAFFANGDRNFSSCDNFLAMSAMEFAHA